MAKVAWSLRLAVLGSLATFGSACTVTVNGGNGPGDDASSGDSGGNTSVGDSSSMPDASVADTATPGTDSGSSPDGGDAASCPILTQITFASDVCDTCIGASCCDQATACFTGAENECDSQFSCFASCLVGNPDAGVPPGSNATCKSDCGGAGGAPPPFSNLVDCVVGTCGAQCQ